MTQNVLKLVHLADVTPQPAEITIEVETQLSKAEFVWRAFENLASGHVFQSFDWVSIWHSTIGRHTGVSPQIVIGREPGGAVLFLLPLGTRRRFGLTMLEWLGGKHAELKAGLFASEFLRQTSAEDWTMLWKRICGSLPHFDIAHLCNQPERLDGAPNPFASVRTHCEADQVRGTRLLGDWESYCEAKRPASWQPEHSGQRRKLDALGELHFEVARDPGRVTELLQKLFRDKAKLLRREGVADPLADAATRTFYWRQAQRMHPHGPAHLSALTLNGKPVAIEWGLIFKGRFYYLLSAYDMRLHRFSPKTRQLNELVRWCLEHGLEHFSFGAGEQGCKYRWCEENMELFSIIKGHTWKGRIAALGFGLKARLSRRTRISKIWRRLAREFRDLLRPPARLRRHEL